MMCNCAFGRLSRDQRDAVYRTVMLTALPHAKRAVADGINDDNKLHIVLVAFASHGLTGEDDLGEPRTLLRILSDPINRIGEALEVSNAAAVLVHAAHTLL